MRINGIPVAPDASLHHRREFRLCELPLPVAVEFVAEATGRTHVAWLEKSDGVYVTGPVRGLPGVTAHLLSTIDVDRVGTNTYRVHVKERRQGRSRVNGW